MNIPPTHTKTLQSQSSSCNKHDCTTHIWGYWMFTCHAHIPDIVAYYRKISQETFTHWVIPSQRKRTSIYPVLLSRRDVIKVLVWKVVVSMGWWFRVTSVIAPGFILTQNCVVLLSVFWKNWPRRAWHPKAQPLCINKHAISQKSFLFLAQT